MKILKINPTVEKENPQLADLDGKSWMEQDIIVTMEPEGGKPEQKYRGKLILTKITDEDTGEK